MVNAFVIMDLGERPFFAPAWSWDEYILQSAVFASLHTRMLTPSFTTVQGPLNCSSVSNDIRRGPADSAIFLPHFYAESRLFSTGSRGAVISAPDIVPPTSSRSCHINEIFQIFRIHQMDLQARRLFFVFLAVSGIRQGSRNRFALNCDMSCTFECMTIQK
jgi:hypothetical protein